MGQPNIVGQTTGSVVEDSGLIVTGDLNDSGNGFADTWTINSGPSYGTATVNAAGTWSYDLDDTNAAVEALNAGETLTDTFVVQLDSLGTDTATVTITIEGVPCLCEGTLIETDGGPLPVETLRAGDLIVTRDHGLRPLLWVGHRTVPTRTLDLDSRTHPIRIKAGTLGGGMPYRDLFVSRQHRMLAHSVIAERMFDVPEVLISAHHMTVRDGIEIAYQSAPVTYFHLLFDRHEVIYAEGAPTESLFISGDALALWPETTRAELKALAQAPPDRTTARPVPTAKQQAALMERCHKNRKAVLSHEDQYFSPAVLSDHAGQAPKEPLKKAG
jgi:VCBS repeat-containing protein